MSLTVFEVFCIAWGLLIGYLMGSGRLRDLGAAAVFALRAIAAVPLWLYFSWRARRLRRRG